MSKTQRIIAAVAVVCVTAAGGAWYYQSEIIGIAAKLYMQRIAAQEQKSGTLTRRRQTVAGLHRRLLIAPPTDPQVPELFDFLTQLSARTASGEISLAWGAYLYTAHVRDALDRPAGAPRPSADQLAAEIQEGVDFYFLQKRPDVAGARVKDLWDDGESFTLEEIQQAAREGRDLTRGD